ncbi:MAG: c-type cytochrome domain-containing protein [Planctomycetia bacterium]
MPSRREVRCLLIAGAMAVAAAAARAADAPPTFNEQVLPIFREKCCGCHNPDKKKGGLDLTSHGQALAGGGSGEVISAGDADGSYLWQLVSHASEPKMPPESDKLPAEMLDVIRRWIAGGAIERAGGAPVARKTTAIAVDAATLTAPEGPPVMPPRLSLEPISPATRSTTITALAASPHGEVAAVGGRRQLLLHHTTSLELLGVLPFPEGVVKTVRFSRNGKLLVAAGGEAAKSGRVVIWDVATAARITELGDEFDEILAADLSADQRLVAIGGSARVVRLLTTADGAVESELRKHTDWVTAVEFSPASSAAGGLLATGDRAGNLFLWEPRGGREHGTLKGHTAAITGMAWRPDGGMLATVSEDGSLRLWNPKESTQLKTWPAHAGGATSVAWLRDGRLVTTGRDRKVKLWKADGPLDRETAPLADTGPRVAATSDGTRLFAADWGGVVTAFTTADAKPAGTLDTNPPPLQKRLDAAEKLLADATAVGQSAAEKAKAATEAMQLAESQVAAARKALAEAEEAAQAAKTRQAETTQQVDRWRAELDFSRSQATPAN